MVGTALDLYHHKTINITLTPIETAKLELIQLIKKIAI